MIVFRNFTAPHRAGGQRCCAMALFAVLALLGAPGLLASGACAATLGEAQIQRPEGLRTYLQVLPDQAAGTRSALRPLVILLHGHGGSPAQLLGERGTAAPMSLWRGLVDTENLLLMAPAGLPGNDHHAGWNDCRQDGNGRSAADDTGLVRALIDRAVQTLHADPARVYVMGMSNGAMMALRLATEMPELLAGVVAISGLQAAHSACAAPERAVPLLLMMGTADPLVPYGGGNVQFISRTSRGAVHGAEDTVATWRRLAGLPDTPDARTTRPHQLDTDTTRATRTVWGTDPAGIQVELLTLEGAGHVEPSLRQRIRAPYTWLVGKQNGDAEAVEEAWAFLRQRRRQGSPA